MKKRKELKRYFPASRAAGKTEGENSGVNRVTSVKLKNLYGLRKNEECQGRNREREYPAQDALLYHFTGCVAIYKHKEYDNGAQPSERLFAARARRLGQRGNPGQDAG